MNLREFADSSGVSVSYLSRIERDQVNPSPNVLRRIAEALHREAGARAVIAEITDIEAEAPHDQPPG